MRTDQAVTDRPQANEAVEFQPIGTGLYRVVVHNQQAIRDAAEKALRIPGEELRRARPKPNKLWRWVNAVIRRATMGFTNRRA